MSQQRDANYWAQSRQASVVMRDYVFPTVGRIVAAALGIGLGYLIAHI